MNWLSVFFVGFEISSTSSNLLGPQFPLLVTERSLHSVDFRKCLICLGRCIKAEAWGAYRDMVQIQKHKIRIGDSEQRKYFTHFYLPSTPVGLKKTIHAFVLLDRRLEEINYFNHTFIAT